MDEWQPIIIAEITVPFLYASSILNALYTFPHNNPTGQLLLHAHFTNEETRHREVK